jgi:hypothetical protein
LPYSNAFSMPRSCVYRRPRSRFTPRKGETQDAHLLFENQFRHQQLLLGPIGVVHSAVVGSWHLNPERRARPHYRTRD